MPDIMAFCRRSVRAVLRPIWRRMATLGSKIIITGIRAYLRSPMEMQTAPVDLTVMAQLIATHSSAQYLLAHMPLAKNCHSQLGLLEFGIQSCSVDGYALEFGVYKGETINYISHHVQKIYGFDTFRGVKEDWRFDLNMSYFDMKGNLPKVEPNVELVVGLFSDTLPKFVSGMNAPVRFLHVDSDIYSSAIEVLNLLADKIVPGTIIVFDEYWNYYGWENHEHKAFMEFIEKRGKKFQYIGFASGHLSVAVKILEA